MVDEQINPLYVAVLEPNEVRKDLLLAAKEVIGLLKAHESFSELAEQKRSRLSELRKVTEELFILNKKLKIALPRAPLDRSLPNASKPARSSSTRSSYQEPVYDDSSLDYIETELRKIEKELHEIND